MNFLSEKFLSYLFKIYLTVVLILMVIKTNGRIKLADTIWGFRGDHFVHSTIFIPYMILIGLIYRNEPLKMIITKKLPLAFLFAAICESIHLFLPYRTFSIFDFFANCIGLSLGLGLSLLLRKILN